jgi:hypothetical protein
MSKRDNFSAAAQASLAKRVAYRCSAPTCRATTIGPGIEDSKTVSVGVACHITAAAPGGPRFDHTLSPGQRSHIENGIWLCQTHAREIDVDPSRYPATLLHQWRDEAEKLARDSVGRAEQHVGASASSKAKEVIARVARASDALLALAEDIVGLPNGKIENIARGVEYDRSRSDLQRQHRQRMRELRRDADEATQVLATPPLNAVIEELFELEAEIRAVIERQTVPYESSFSSRSEWQRLEQLSAEIRRVVM